MLCASFAPACCQGFAARRPGRDKPLPTICSPSSASTGLHSAQPLHHLPTAPSAPTCTETQGQTPSICTGPKPIEQHWELGIIHTMKFLESLFYFWSALYLQLGKQGALLGTADSPAATTGCSAGKKSGVCLVFGIFQCRSMPLNQL